MPSTDRFWQDRRVFVTGGPVHGVAFGVFTAALSVAVSPLTPGPTLGEPPAVAGLRFGDLPRPVAVTGLAAAASGLLGPLYFVWEPAGWFIPGGRFPGLIVCGIAGTRLAGRRSASEGGSS